MSHVVTTGPGFFKLTSTAKIEGALERRNAVGRRGIWWYRRLMPLPDAVIDRFDKPQLIGIYFRFPGFAEGPDPGSITVVRAGIGDTTEAQEGVSSVVITRTVGAETIKLVEQGPWFFPISEAITASVDAGAATPSRDGLGAITDTWVGLGAVTVARD